MHLMIDLETLNTTPSSVILSAGACYFDANGIKEQFYSELSIQDQLDMGRTISHSTLAFWSEQPNFTSFIYSPKVSILNFIIDFLEYLNLYQESIIWANAPSFDLVILEDLYNSLRTELPWNFRNFRDFRTLRKIFPSCPRIGGSDHHALHDALSQAEYIIQNFPGVL